ncbi:MAG: radical SAM protein, partial [Chloroflexi bacterium]
MRGPTWFDVFAIPVAERVLIYAPLHDLAALVDRPAAVQLRLALAGGNAALRGPVGELFDALSSAGRPVPQPRPNRPGAPLFLGLVLTRGCNMACRYCDFAAPKHTSPVMDLDTARAAIDVYLDRLVAEGGNHAELHLFGGEPFFAPRVVHFAAAYFQARTAELGLTTRLEAITNGLFNQNMARWVARTFDTVFLSLDGPRDIQDSYRPALGGNSAFEVIQANSRLFSEEGIELILRACVTSETVGRLPEIAAWFAQEFHPARVCFETMLPSDLARSSGLEPPDPWEFVRSYDQATRVLAEHGIETVLSTAELSVPHVTFCPVGKDAMIVTPDGAVHACYLLEEDWRKAGLDLTYGKVEPRPGEAAQFTEIPGAVERIRELNVHAY